MLRSAFAVAAGFITWTVLFLGLAAAVRALFPDAHGADGQVVETGVLLVYLALTVLASVAAGFAAARVAAAHHARTVLVTGIVLLAVGLAVQISSWDFAPAWYNVAFLAVLLPLTVVGGRLAGAPASRSAAVRA